MTSTVRAAVESDRDALAALKVASWSATYADLVPAAVLAPLIDIEHQRSRFESILADRSQRILVAVESVVIGLVVCELAHSDGPYIDALHVAPDHRSLGIGRQLLTAIAQSVGADGYTALHLHVVEGNTRAITFYERLGGRCVGRGCAHWAPDDVTEVAYRWTDLRAITAM